MREVCCNDGDFWVFQCGVLNYSQKNEFLLFILLFLRAVFVFLQTVLRGFWFEYHSEFVVLDWL
ncbi:hypothetical protein AWM61_07910 [Riemerella anatipestifer]|nr:hypothetical protein AWR40_08895 [Riemerella anatipestifer]OBP42326.1 hypothetical protein AWR42_08440 [Riemerella anatipestifer]OBP46782.1 hypothetical protein AWM67_09220 [Riemerella anatipestifer]OBP50288.1 hypothetical protein AWM64_08330 [Riemerella anatipestifer]OBP50437.1 hypothetical protein AWM65_00110 [Riemerella anatipestifer]